METDYVKLTKTSEIGIGKMKVVKNGDLEILIINFDGNYYAVDNKCTHLGGELSKGKLEGKIITCPRHHSQFDISNGKVVTPPSFLFMHPTIKNLRTYQLKVEQGDIFIKTN